MTKWSLLVLHELMPKVTLALFLLQTVHFSEECSFDHTSCSVHKIGKNVNNK